MSLSTGKDLVPSWITLQIHCY